MGLRVYDVVSDCVLFGVDVFELRVRFIFSLLFNVPLPSLVSSRSQFAHVIHLTYDIDTLSVEDVFLKILRALKAGLRLQISKPAGSWL